jgi:hypothetical protein
MTLDRSCQVSQHPHRDRGNDCYSTPAVAVDALLKVQTLPYRIWECAAGHGNIVNVLREAGHVVVASDNVHYDFALDFEADFLKVTQAPAGIEAVVTNPPFMHATDFVEHALELCPRVFMLLRLAFLESKRRSEVLDTGMLAAIHPFIDRLPFLHRGSWTGPRASSAIPFVWLVWDRNHQSQAVHFERISWRDSAHAAGEVSR